MEVKWLLFFTVFAAVVYSTLEENINVLTGKNITLLCQTNSLSDSIFWQYDSTVIAARISGNSHLINSTMINKWMLLSEGLEFNLNVMNAQIADEGKYVCQLPGPDKEYDVVVNVPPTVSLNPSDREIDIQWKENISVHCNGFGKPPPNVTWEKVDDNVFVGDKQKSKLLQFQKIKKSASGTYRCTADNGLGITEFKEIAINVRYKPAVVVEENNIHTGPGEDVSIKCSFEANPIAKVQWRFNNSEIQNDHHYTHHSEVNVQTSEVASVLYITDIDSNLFGTYTCVGQNDWGMAKENIRIYGIPVILEVSSGNDNNYINQYTIKWQVRSKAEVLEYHLSLKEENDSSGSVTWRNFSLTPGKSIQEQSGGIPYHAYKIGDLYSNITYTVKLRAVNVVGVGNWSEGFHFTTVEVGEMAPADTTDHVYDIFTDSISSRPSGSLVMTVLAWIYLKFML